MSSKAVMIKTFKYQFRLNVEIASNAEPINIGFSDTFNGFRSVGHAWWKVGLTNNSIEMENIDLASHQNANHIGVDVGYYPLNSTLPPDFSSPGELKVNDSGSADCYREKELTRQFSFTMGLTGHTRRKPPKSAERVSRRMVRRSHYLSRKVPESVKGLRRRSD